MYLRVCERVLLPLMQAHDVFDIPENRLFLVEDVERKMATRVQVMEPQGLHLLYKLLLSINQALNQLAKDIRGTEWE